MQFQSMVLIAFIVAAAPAAANTLDQANEGSFVLAAYAADSREGRPFLETGQSFTAGLTGQLTRIDLALWRGFYRLPGGDPVPCERLGAEVRDIAIENQKIIESGGFNPFKPDPKSVKKMHAVRQRLVEIKGEAIERECSLDAVFALDNVFAKAD